MKPSQEQIAEAFSYGEFEKVFPCLHDDIEWHVFGQFHVQGRAAVEKRCREIADYFKSVTTEFKQGTKIVESGKVAVSGTAEFSKDGKRLEFVNACDIYEFRDDKLRRIASYCVTKKYSQKQEQHCANQTENHAISHVLRSSGGSRKVLRCGAARLEAASHGHQTRRR